MFIFHNLYLLNAVCNSHNFLHELETFLYRRYLLGTGIYGLIWKLYLLNRLVRTT